MHAVEPRNRRWLRRGKAEDARAALREIDAGLGQLLSRGDQAEVYLHYIAGMPRILKVAHGRGLAAWLRRRMLRKEARVYRQLAGIDGLPGCYGLVEGRCLVLEHFDGKPYRQADIPHRDLFFAELRKMIDAMHERGVAHGDLKTRDNILVTSDGLPHIVDFGIAMLRRPRGGPLNRWWFELFRQFDRNAWIKLKYKGRMDAIETPDLAWHHVTNIERLARRARRALQRARR